MGTVLGVATVLALARHAPAIRQAIHDMGSVQDPLNLLGESISSMLPADWQLPQSGGGAGRTNRVTPVHRQAGNRWNRLRWNVDPIHPQAARFNPNAVINKGEWSSRLQQQIADWQQREHPLLDPLRRRYIKSGPRSIRIESDPSAVLAMQSVQI